MAKETKEKLLKDIKISEQKLNEQYRPYGDKANKELADIWYEIMWSEKMPPEKKTLTDEKLKKLRNLFVEALREQKRLQEEEKKHQKDLPRRNKERDAGG